MREALAKVVLTGEDLKALLTIVDETSVVRGVDSPTYEAALDRVEAVVKEARENPHYEHPTGQTFPRFIRVDALLHGTAPPHSCEVSWEDDEGVLTMRWSRVLSGDHGDEALTLKFRGTQYSDSTVHVGTMPWFVAGDLAASEAEAHPAREPNPPTLQIIKREALLNRRNELQPIDEWLEQAVCRSQPDVQVNEMPFEEKDDLHLIGLPQEHIHWSKHDEHFVAWFDGGVLTIAEVCYDDYVPADESELCDMVSSDLDAFFDRAASVQYRYSSDTGWQRLCHEDQSGGVWTGVKSNRFEEG